MEPIKCYAGCHMDSEIRMHSSSGGVFSALAAYVFSLGGVVYGVAMSEDCYSAEFIAVSEPAGLERLRGSKYLQADTGNAYRQVLQDLLAGKTVLFAGTGCQVNGLKCFLGQAYDRLICVDMICHGVPSPSLWKAYVRHQERKLGGKIKTVDFRCKDAGWKDFGMKVSLEGPGNACQRYASKDNDPYMQMFLRNMCLRPSCYACAAKKMKLSDLTIADFWGIEKAAPEMDDNKGTSLIIVRTERGKEVFHAASGALDYKEIPYSTAIAGNSAESRSVARPSERETIFVALRSMSFAELEKKYAGAPVRRRLRRAVRAVLRRVCRVVFPTVLRIRRKGSL